MINTYIHFYLYVLYVYLTYVYISEHIVVPLSSLVIIKRFPRFYSFSDMYRNRVDSICQKTLDFWNGEIEESMGLSRKREKELATHHAKSTKIGTKNITGDIRSKP